MKRELKSRRGLGRPNKNVMDTIPVDNSTHAHWLHTSLKKIRLLHFTEKSVKPRQEQIRQHWPISSLAEGGKTEQGTADYHTESYAQRRHCHYSCNQICSILFTACNNSYEQQLFFRTTRYI